MNKFLTIDMAGNDQGFIGASFKSDKVLAFNKDGKTVVVIVDGWATPFTFNLARDEAATSLYKQIQKEMA